MIYILIGVIIAQNVNTFFRNFLFLKLDTASDPSIQLEFLPLNAEETLTFISLRICKLNSLETSILIKFSREKNTKKIKKLASV